MPLPATRNAPAWQQWDEWLSAITGVGSRPGVPQPTFGEILIALANAGVEVPDEPPGPAGTPLRPRARQTDAAT